jgi:hypothetical protein
MGIQGYTDEEFNQALYCNLRPLSREKQVSKKSIAILLCVQSGFK